eukprot:g7489.t1
MPDRDDGVSPADTTSSSIDNNSSVIGSFDADVTTVLAGHARHGKRDGYSNLGLGLAVSETAETGIVSDDDGHTEEEATAGFVAGTARGGRKKMSYVGLGDGGADSAGAELSDGGAEEVGEGGEGKDKASRRLAIFGLLNLAYVVLQMMGAMAYRSLALMSDGFHNLSDVAAIGMAMYIHRLQRRRCDENADGGTDSLPFGYKRAEVIGGLMNSVALIALSAYIVLSAIPRLIVPTEVKDGWCYIALAFGGVLVNLVGVLFFLYSGEDAHDCGSFLTAHNHSHDHGHEEPAGLDSLGLLTLVDPVKPYDIPSTAVLSTSTEGRVDDDEEVSVVLAGSDPIGRVRLEDTAAARGEFFFSGDGGDEEEGGWVGAGGGRGSGCGGGTSHYQEEEEHTSSHSHSHSHGEHSHVHGHRSQIDGGGDDGEGGGRCGGGGAGVGQNGGGHSHDHGHANGRACNGHQGGESASGKAEVELKKVHGKHGAAAVGGHGEGHGHEHRVHGHHASAGCSGGGCSHGNGHAHGYHAHEHGAEGGCKGHSALKSMNLWAVLVHAIADAVSSGVVCVQGIVAYSFGKDGVDWTDYLDPLTSIVLSVFIVYCALPVVKECSHVLLEGTPRSADVRRLRRELLEVRGISSIQGLSVTQLNSGDPFVASVTLVAEVDENASREEAAVGKTEGGREEGATPGRALAARNVAKTTALAGAVKAVLARHNIGRNTVEIVLTAGDPPRGEGAGFEDGAKGEAGSGGGDGWGACLSAGGSRGGRNEAERRQHGAGGRGGSGSKSHGGHSHGHGHGQCSGHGHSHAHAASVDFV